MLGQGAAKIDAKKRASEDALENEEREYKDIDSQTH
jgi:hypothetical protein